MLAQAHLHMHWTLQEGNINQCFMPLVAPLNSEQDNNTSTKSLMSPNVVGKQALIPLITRKVISTTEVL